MEADGQGRDHVHRGFERRRHQIPDFWDDSLQDLQLDRNGNFAAAIALRGKPALAS